MSSNNTGRSYTLITVGTLLIVVMVIGIAGFIPIISPLLLPYVLLVPTYTLWKLGFALAGMLGGFFFMLFPIFLGIWLIRVGRKGLAPSIQ